MAVLVNIPVGLVRQHVQIPKSDPLGFKEGFGVYAFLELHEHTSPTTSFSHSPSDLIIFSLSRNQLKLPTLAPPAAVSPLFQYCTSTATTKLKSPLRVFKLLLVLHLHYHCRPLPIPPKATERHRIISSSFMVAEGYFRTCALQMSNDSALKCGACKQIY